MLLNDSLILITLTLSYDTIRSLCLPHVILQPCAPDSFRSFVLLVIMV